MWGAGSAVASSYSGTAWSWASRGPGHWESRSRSRGRGLWPLQVALHFFPHILGYLTLVYGWLPGARKGWGWELGARQHKSTAGPGNHVQDALVIFHGLHSLAYHNVLLLLCLQQPLQEGKVPPPGLGASL